MDQQPDDNNSDQSRSFTSTVQLGNLYDELSAEAEQESDYVDPTKSFIETISDPVLFTEREREYKDIEKHWVRTKVWLKAAREIAEETRAKHQRGIRYFTLPAYYRLDVSLLLREGLLDIVESSADGKAKKVHVAAFEADPTKFARMVGHSPEFSLFGHTSVEDALTNDANPHYEQLLRLFPFDVVNLDLTTSLTPQHEGPYSSTMKAIDAVLKRQADHGIKWALLLTFRNMPDEWEEDTVEQLIENLQKNIDAYPQVLEAFDRLYGETRVHNFHRDNPKKCISQAVVKWLVDRANSYGLRFEQLYSYFYERANSLGVKYDIYKYVLYFSKGTIYHGIVPTKGIPPQPWMSDNLVKCITQHKPVDVIEKILSTLDRVPEFSKELEDDIKSLCMMIQE
jgi:hypothetical protein